MNKEKQCKCCKEESCFLDIVTGLCPNCYDYFKQLKQQLEEKDEQIKKRVMVYEKQFIEQTDEIYSLKQQLAEAEEYIENDEVTKREYYQKTDEIIAKKDKEIKRLKNLFKLNNEVVINQGKEIFDLRVQVLQQKQNQKQLAIQELEKVKEWLEPKYFDYEQINYLTRIIDNQIRTLKNEEGR